MSLSEASETPMSPSTPPPSSQMSTFAWALAASLLTAIILSVGGALIMSWRSEPMTASTLTKLEARVDKVELRLEEQTKTQAQHSSDIRANRGEIDGLKAIVSDIKTYQYRTSEEMKKISEDLARIGGWITRGQRTTPKDPNE